MGVLAPNSATESASKVEGISGVQAAPALQHGVDQLLT